MTKNGIPNASTSSLHSTQSTKMHNTELCSKIEVGILKNQTPQCYCFQDFISTIILHKKPKVLKMWKTPSHQRLPITCGISQHAELPSESYPHKLPNEPSQAKKKRKILKKRDYASKIYSEEKEKKRKITAPHVPQPHLLQSHADALSPSRPESRINTSPRL
ncbi:hypothetical protein NPIL_173641 [Nephila pilipes]|uniref:Uncharacterized protein n=1 Tax=Nephila pilipes TaxID=299642 RepID=A0A8X6NXL8_NEPPI|nr:hypothetical protein NPIL_173641 [Nephila pilipes]